MSLKTPVHPGSIVREDCIDELGLTVKSAAEQLGVTRQTLSNLINGRSALTPEMSIRLEKIGWGNAAQWIRLQGNYDLAQARIHEDQIAVHRTAR